MANGAWGETQMASGGVGQRALAAKAGATGDFGDRQLSRSKPLHGLANTAALYVLMRAVSGSAAEHRKEVARADVYLARQIGHADGCLEVAQDKAVDRVKIKRCSLLRRVIEHTVVHRMQQRIAQVPAQRRVRLQLGQLAGCEIQQPLQATVQRHEAWLFEQTQQQRVALTDLGQVDVQNQHVVMTTA